MVQTDSSTSLNWADSSSLDVHNDAIDVQGSMAGNDTQSAGSRVGYSLGWVPGVIKWDFKKYTECPENQIDILILNLGGTTNLLRDLVVYLIVDVSATK